MAAAIKGEHCTLTYIRGVKILEDYEGNDLMKMIKKGNKNSDGDVDGVIRNLMSRIDALEKIIKNMPTPGVGPAGPAGPEGPMGETGKTGAQGPRGKDGAKATMADLLDVCMDGLDDGDVLMYNANKKQWIASRD
jgi:hypothetical protein